MSVLKHIGVCENMSAFVMMYIASRLKQFHSTAGNHVSVICQALVQTLVIE